MADKKISQLTAIDAVNVATNDVLAIVDIDAGSDGTKKITVEELRKLIVALYNGADIKIATSGTGVDVTGTATMDVPADGDIAIFKEGSDTVGTIGAKANDLFIQTGGFGIRFTDAANAIRPCDATGGANAVMDIGDATVPWRNLYLSGNVIVDSGKGIDFSADGQAAGMTSELLDDYEEGTYAVNLYDASSAGNASPTTVTGYYTKIGQQVTVAFRNLNDIDTTGMTAANPLYISLPFQSAALAALWVGSVIVDTVNLSLRTQVNSAVENGGSRGTFIYSGTSVSDNFVKVQDLTTGTSDIRGYTMTYFAA